MKFKYYWSYHYSIFKHKKIQSVLSYSTSNPWFECVVCWSRHVHQAGLTVNLGLAGYRFHFMLFDQRQWDYENQRWTKYNYQQSMDMT